MDPGTAFSLDGRVAFVSGGGGRDRLGDRGRRSAPPGARVAVCDMSAEQRRGGGGQDSRRGL